MHIEGSNSLDGPWQVLLGEAVYYTVSSIALTEMGDLHHEVTVKCAAASIAGNQVFSLIKPVSL